MRVKLTDLGSALGWVGRLMALSLLGTIAAVSAQPAPASAPARFPPGVSRAQTARIGGKVLRYQAHAGWLPVFDRTGRVIARMSYVSFIRESRSSARRPVTFALNGGPGSASAGLALGIGPNTLTLGVSGTGPSSPLDWRAQSFGAVDRSLALDPHLRVMMANGYTDLACPFMMSRLAADQIPPAVKGDRLELEVYPGGHEFYSRPHSALAFMHDVEELYRAGH